MLAIDAKFSLNNYQKYLEARGNEFEDEYLRRFKSDIKKRIDETAKYIKPEEHTMDFAFMFIPSETLYYDLLTNTIGTGLAQENLIEYAYTQRRVIIISPTTILAYLQTIVQGMKSLQIEEKAQEIIKQLGKLHAHIKRCSESMNRLGKNLESALNHHSNSTKQFSMLDTQIGEITSGADTPPKSIAKKRTTARHSGK